MTIYPCISHRVSLNMEMTKTQENKFSRGQFQFHLRKLVILETQDMTFDKFLHIHFNLKGEITHSHQLS